jgi:hypothetical protein
MDGYFSWFAGQELVIKIRIEIDLLIIIIIWPSLIHDLNKMFFFQISQQVIFLISCNLFYKLFIYLYVISYAIFFLKSIVFFTIHVFIYFYFCIYMLDINMLDINSCNSMRVNKYFFNWQISLTHNLRVLLILSYDHFAWHLIKKKLMNQFSEY